MSLTLMILELLISKTFFFPSDKMNTMKTEFFERGKNFSLNKEIEFLQQTQIF